MLRDTARLIDLPFHEMLSLVCLCYLHREFGRKNNYTMSSFKISYVYFACVFIFKVNKGGAAMSAVAFHQYGLSSNLRGDAIM